MLFSLLAGVFGKAGYKFHYFGKGSFKIKGWMYFLLIGTGKLAGDYDWHARKFFGNVGYEFIKIKTLSHRGKM